MMRRAFVTFIAAICAAASTLAVVSPVEPLTSAQAVPLASTVLASSSAGGAPSNAPSDSSDLSADGRYVVFESAATNLVSPTPVRQIYRKDLVTGEIIVVSAKSNGQEGTAESTDPSISDDGRFVAFSSASLNFGAADVRVPQVFIRDLSAGGSGLTMISRNPATGQPGNGRSTQAVLSGSGSHVVFVSEARDLAPVVTGSVVQIYEADLTTGLTPPIVRVSLQDSALFPNPQGADEQSNLPAVSADGGVVVFMSAASNLTTDDGFATAQVWRHEVATGRTTLISERAAGGGVTRAAWSPDVSADGRSVVFYSDAEVLAGVSNGLQHVYLRDVVAGTTSLVDVTRSGGPPSGTFGASSAEISADGRVVVFMSDARDLGPDLNPGGQQLYRRILATGATTLISTTLATPHRGGDNRSYPSGVSADGSSVAFVSSATDLTGDVVPRGYEQVFVRRMQSPAVDRIGGADRYSVSAGVARDEFGPERAVVYVASGADFADALSASAAAGMHGGPVLLVTKDAIPTDVADELARLKPARIVIAGGTKAISPEIEGVLAASAPVVRIGGADRFEVSARVSRTEFASAGTVYLASGTVFPDALAGAAATGGRSPVLLVTKDTVPPAIRAELARLAPSRIVVLGGTNAISDAVVASLPRSAAVMRVGGADRDVVSAAISALTFANGGAETVFVASGATFPDALSGSAAAIAERAPVLLVTGTGVPAAVGAELRRLAPHRIVLLGGTAAVSDGVRAELATYLATG